MAQSPSQIVACIVVPTLQHTARWSTQSWSQLPVSIMQGPLIDVHHMAELVLRELQGPSSRSSVLLLHDHVSPSQATALIPVHPVLYLSALVRLRPP